MAAQKKYDLVVVTGEYTTRDGNTKKTYETVGALFEGDKGPYLMIKRTFNFAALAMSLDRQVPLLKVLVGFPVNLTISLSKIRGCYVNQ